jgi:hypothetical protein
MEWQSISEKRNCLIKLSFTMFLSEWIEFINMDITNGKGWIGT